MGNPGSSSLLGVWVAVLLFFPAAWAQERGGRIVDRAVALVEGRVITLSELEFEARAMLVRAGGVEAASAPLDEAALKDALQASIGQRLGAAEADKLQAYPLGEGEVELALTAFKRRFFSEAEYRRFLDRHEADTQLLAACLTRALRSEKLLESKLRPKAQVSEAEVRRYYEEHQAELSGRRYDQIHGVLRQKLFAERFGKLAEKELERLRRGADVRILAPFAKARAEAAP